MNVTIESTTDSNDDVIKATGSSQKTVDDSASVKDTDETTDESDTSESAEEDSESHDEGDEEEGNQDDEKSDDKPQKKRSGFKRRIDKLSKRLTEKEAETEYWKQEALKKNQQAPEKSEASLPQAASEGRPDPDSFDLHEEYVEALTEWKLEQKLQEREVRERQERAKSEGESIFSAHMNRVDQFRQAHDDFDEVIEDVSSIPVPSTIQEAIITSENGPELMYQLAKNPEEFERLCKLSPLQAARELGKFEAKLSQSSLKKPETKKTNAPPPINPVGSKATKSTRSPEEMSFQEYKKWRESK